MKPIKEILEIVNHFREFIPVDVEGLALALGIRVNKVYLQDDLSGLIQNVGDDRFEISVNARHSDTRQRFTVAHELGHYVLHRFLIGDGNADDCAYRSNGAFKNNKIGPRQETEANKFAANLLMPAEAIIRLREEGIDDFVRMARRLRVSEGAMKIRLGIKNDANEGPSVHFPRVPAMQESP
jgi:Zn-dependent peptidase ImmA (M78 family)